MRRLLFFVLGLATFSSFALPKEVLDTIYYDSNWKGCSKTFATYYRIMTVPTNENPRKQFRDFYITGEIAGEGNYISIDSDDNNESIFDGEIVYFYKSGQIKHQSKWINSHKVGDSYDFFENGNVKYHYCYNDGGRIDGNHSEFDNSGNLIKLVKYNNGMQEADFTSYNQFGAMGRYNTKTFEFSPETVSISDMKTKVIKGEKYFYFDDKNGLYLSVVVESVKHYGKYYKVYVFLFNNSNTSFLFDPSKITASGKFYKRMKKNSKTPYHELSAKRRDRGEYTYDETTEKVKDIRVWTYKDYMNKVEERQDWDRALKGLGEAFANSDAGYSISYSKSNVLGSRVTTATASYDATAAAIAQERSAQRISTFSAHLESDIQAIKDNYMQATTLDPQTEVAGYILLNKDKPAIIELSVPVNGVVYTFEITDIPD